MSDEKIIEALTAAAEVLEALRSGHLDSYAVDMAITRARTALAAYRKAAWRPIEEAPRDGCSVLVYCGLDHDPMWGVGSYYGDGWHMWWEGNNHPPHDWPTHFQPLPPPPE